MKKSKRDNQFWGNIFLISFTGLVVFVFAYTIGVLPWLSWGAQTNSTEPIVAITYDGGFLADPGAAKGSDRIYPDGRVVTLSRDGNTMRIQTVNGNEISALKSHIENTETMEQAFEEKEYFCNSAFDGIDSEWRIQHADGSVAIYSSCDYTIHEDNAFVRTVMRLTESSTAE